MGVTGGGGAETSPSAFAAALAAAEREERRRRRRQGGDSSCNDGDQNNRLASAARALSLRGGVSSWADFLKAQLASEGTVHSSKALGWLPPQPLPRNAASSSSAAALQFVPGARRPGWGPPMESSNSIIEAVEEGTRRLAERCDRLGGFLTFADDARGWGSSASAAMALLRDEYARTPRILFALRPPDSLFGSSGGVAGGKKSATAGEKSVSASAVAAAFSTGALAPLAGLFVPLAPPSALWSSSSSPDSSSPCDALFRWSAAAAAAIDAATTPLRLLSSSSDSSSSSSSSSSLGGFGAASLAALLRGPRGGSLAALSAALPLSGVPVTGGGAGRAAAAAAAAAEQQKRDGREAGRTESSSWASPPAVSCWTPGLSNARNLFAEGSLLAESVTLRGALSPRSPLSSSPPPRRLSAPESLAALEAALECEGSRAVRQLCASPAPLHLPLPFPEGMLPRWCYGRGGGGGGGGGGEEEREGLGGGGAPVLVRLAASRALASLAADSADLLTRGEAARSSSSSKSRSRHAAGLRSSRAGDSSRLAGALRPLFDSWGLDAGDDASAAVEAARSFADEYRGGGSDGVLSSGGDSDDEED